MLAILVEGAMPLQLKRRCAFHGCPNTTRQRYCDEHLALARKFADRKRGTTTERGYDGPWKRLAKQRRELDCYLCQECLKQGIVTASPLVDHIIPIHIRPDWRLEIDNTQVLCELHHGIKSGEDLVRYGGRTNQNLTPTQLQNRAAALKIEHPTRCDEMNTTAK
jgi:5-methylcytosine-specific restriction protein A